MMSNDSLLESVAQLFRMTYQQGTCDPANCPQCDCHLDDVLRERIHAESERLAQDVIAKVEQHTISTTNKTWGDRAFNAERKLRIVRAQRDLLAQRSGLPIPLVNGETYA